jgi:hypothetical protein
MREATGAGGDTLSLAEEQWINEVCNRFELAWKAGERPRIEDYVGERRALWVLRKVCDRKGPEEGDVAGARVIGHDSEEKRNP